MHDDTFAKVPPVSWLYTLLLDARDSFITCMDWLVMSKKARIQMC